MPNRLNRDQLIKTALDMSQVQNLENHDMPNGVVQPDAYSIRWIQDILDFWYHMVPFSSTIVDAFSLDIPAASKTIPVPTDFILDVRNGYIVQTTSETTSLRRMHRVPLQKWVNRDIYYQTVTSQYPVYYMIQGRNIRVTPAVTNPTTAFLWYYKLPDVLESASVPEFPNDYVIIEYLRIRASEWVGIYEPGTAQKFCDKIIAAMRATGLMNEPEDDEIPFDEISYRKETNYVTTYAWMGLR